MTLKEKVNTFIGSIGAFVGIVVFIAYIPQIIANIEGIKGQPWHPLFASISCCLWAVYGATKTPKADWLLVAPNAFGTIISFLTFITAI